MSVFDSIGTYLFWAPWLGLLSLISPMLIIAWGWRTFPTIRWLWLLLPLCASTLLILVSPLFIYFIVVFDLIALWGQKYDIEISFSALLEIINDLFIFNFATISLDDKSNTVHPCVQLPLTILRVMTIFSARVML